MHPPRSVAPAGVPSGAGPGTEPAGASRVAVENRADTDQRENSPDTVHAAMKISHFCIDRPVFASVLSIVITLAGAVALYNLPIAQYPEISPVEISVSATYPGASAEIAAQNVASPIEQQVNGADKLMYMSSSSSSSGDMTLSVYFDIDADPSLAQVEVQNRVSLALPLLPSSVQAQGVAVKKQSSSMMMVIAIYSPDERYQPVYVANYASIYLLDAIKRIPGAGQATIMGTPDYAIRVWLKPDRMAALGDHRHRCPASGFATE